MGINVDVSGSFANTVKRLQALNTERFIAVLHQYGPVGVAALSAATPTDTGETAHSWTYEVVKEGNSYQLVWKNTHVVDGANIALLIQYGHGTGTGGYIPGRDYINPAMRPVFDKILADIRKVVSA